MDLLIQPENDFNCYIGPFTCRFRPKEGIGSMKMGFIVITWNSGIYHLWPGNSNLNAPTPQIRQVADNFVFYSSEQGDEMPEESSFVL